MDTFDAKHAFLRGILKEEIYMHQPPGFEDGDWRVFVWRMLYMIYGLKQSALEWYEQVCAVMSDLGFVWVDLDHVLFYYDEVHTADADHVECFISWHVNDGMAISSSESFLAQVKTKIAAHFGIKDLRPVIKYLRVQFEHNQAAHTIHIHQSEYISFLLEEYGLVGCSPIHLPADLKVPLGDLSV